MPDPESKKEIITLHAEKPDEGELRYSFDSKTVKTSSGGPDFLSKVIGVAIGITLFLLLIFFFVYVIIPIILIVIVWSFIRRLLQK